MEYLNLVNRTANTGNAQKLTAVHKLFTEIAPRYTDREGGYTRVVRTRLRAGDKAQMALVQFVEKEIQKKDRGDKRKRRVKKGTDAVASKAVETAKQPAAGESTASAE